MFSHSLGGEPTLALSIRSRRAKGCSDGDGVPPITALGLMTPAVQRTAGVRPGSRRCHRGAEVRHEQQSSVCEYLARSSAPSRCRRPRPLHRDGFLAVTAWEGLVIAGTALSCSVTLALMFLRRTGSGKIDLLPAAGVSCTCCCLCLWLGRQVGPSRDALFFAAGAALTISLAALLMAYRKYRR